MEPHESQFNNCREYYPSTIDPQEADSNDDSQSHSYDSHQNGSSTGEQSYSRVKYQYHPPQGQMQNYAPPPPQNYQNYQNPPQNYQNPQQQHFKNPPPQQQQYANYNKRPSNENQDDF